MEDVTVSLLGTPRLFLNRNVKKRGFHQDRIADFIVRYLRDKGDLVLTRDSGTLVRVGNDSEVTLFLFNHLQIWNCATYLCGQLGESTRLQFRARLVPAIKTTSSQLVKVQSDWQIPFVKKMESEISDFYLFSNAMSEPGPNREESIDFFLALARVPYELIEVKQVRGDHYDGIVAVR